MLLNIIEDAMLIRSFCGILQNIWSTRLHERLANLVGRVIFGKKIVCAHQIEKLFEFLSFTNV